MGGYLCGVNCSIKNQEFFHPLKKRRATKPLDATTRWEKNCCRREGTLTR